MMDYRNMAGKITWQEGRQLMSDLGIQRDLSGKWYGSGWIGRHGVCGKPQVEEQYDLGDGYTLEMGWTWGLQCGWIISPEMKKELIKTPRNVKDESAFR